MSAAALRQTYARGPVPLPSPTGPARSKGVAREKIYLLNGTVLEDLARSREWAQQALSLARSGQDPQCQPLLEQLKERESAELATVARAYDARLLQLEKEAGEPYRNRVAIYERERKLIATAGDELRVELEQLTARVRAMAARLASTSLAPHLLALREQQTRIRLLGQTLGPASQEWKNAHARLGHIKMILGVGCSPQVHTNEQRMVADYLALLPQVEELERRYHRYSGLKDSEISQNQALARAEQEFYWSTTTYTAFQEAAERERDAAAAVVRERYRKQREHLMQEFIDRRLHQLEAHLKLAERDLSVELRESVALREWLGRGPLQVRTTLSGKTLSLSSGRARVNVMQHGDGTVTLRCERGSAMLLRLPDGTIQEEVVTPERRTVRLKSFHQTGYTISEQLYEQGRLVFRRQENKSARLFELCCERRNPDGSRAVVENRFGKGNTENLYRELTPAGELRYATACRETLLTTGERRVENTIVRQGVARDVVVEITHRDGRRESRKLAGA